jgi:hypothetical protein
VTLAARVGSFVGLGENVAGAVSLAAAVGGCVALGGMGEGVAAAGDRTPQANPATASSASGQVPRLMRA